MSCNHLDLEEVMESVEIYQGGGQRHICAGCAYLLGQKHRANGTKFDPSKVDDLPESQALPQRHRNAYDAYRIGYHNR